MTETGKQLWHRDGTLKQFYVYIISNKSMTLYAGITSNLPRRIYEHKERLIKGFSSRYHFDRLVYFEQFESAERAILREKVIKGWSRSKKIALIKIANPEWMDLSAT